jgi:hypothetical protein
MKTRLDPWCARLLAVVAAAPLLHCGGSTSGDDETNGRSGGETSGGSAGSSSAGSGAGGGYGGSVETKESGGTGGVTNTGGSVASAGSAGAGTAGSGPSSKGSCQNPRPTVVGADTGYEYCEEGFSHRPEIKSCISLLPREPEGEPGEEEDQCTSDADCTERPYGYCERGNEPLPFRYCAYGCIEDSDCAQGQICVCGSFIGECRPASCKSDADCDDGALCASYVNVSCFGSGFACQHPADECMSGKDCQRDDVCVFRHDEGVRRCQPIDSCAVAGRPFLVGESSRVAIAEPRADWISEEIEYDARGFSAEERAALGAAWLQNALMEHASVAAFARFTLELLAVGAPADLIRDSNAAASDETRHAKLCFALASEYLGEPAGPGPLHIDGALDEISLEKLVVTAIHEGCVGETVAAVEAAEKLAHAKDPAVCAVLAQISEDETRHAELAWRFVKWALEREPSLRSVVEREFDKVLSQSSAPVVSAVGLDLTRHGVLSERARAELRAAVLDRVISEAALALLNKTSAPRHPAAPLLSV